MSLLFDFYGQLLTDRQREFFSLYYDDDLSLGEIASQYGVSRQAVYDILRRSTHTLEELETKLELVSRFEAEQSVLAEVDALLAEAEGELAEGADGAEGALERVRRARTKLKGLWSE